MAVSLNAGVDKTDNAKTHSFLRVGQEYSFVKCGPSFMAEVVEIGDENWVLVRKIARDAADKSLRQSSGPTWINISKINIIQTAGTASDKQAKQKSHSFLQIGHHYRFANEKGEDIVVKVVDVPNNRWVKIECHGPEGEVKTSEAPLYTWINTDTTTSIAETSSDARSASPSNAFEDLGNGVGVPSQSIDDYAAKHKITRVQARDRMKRESELLFWQPRPHLFQR
jgi:hypothetical protein